MIISFKHKGLQELFEYGETRKLPQVRLIRIIRILGAIDSADNLKNLNLPGFRLHRLKGFLEGFYSIDVTANYRIIFRFNNGNASELDYMDTH